ncbi:MAG: hypothetical protein KIS77_11910 [Saprospiraceae bacterium]|nr:hypothetical protein [Saprospiraceae bacterium]
MNKPLSKTSPLAVLLFLVGMTLWLGCKKDDKKGPECNISGVTFAYSANIKGIIDRHCISCHAPGSGVSGADVFDFTNYEAMKPHLDAGHVLERVVIKKDMPQGGAMTQAERDSVNCWIQAGYPKN